MVVVLGRLARFEKLGDCSAIDVGLRLPTEQFTCGCLEGRTDKGKSDTSQIKWLTPTLQAIAKANKKTSPRMISARS
jgi:hypothetical protein